MKNLKTFLIALLVITAAVQAALGQATNVYIMQDNIKVAGITTDAQIDTLALKRKQTTLQYLDGFFRPVQVIGRQASPQQNDVIQPVVYDNLGRQTKAYLPYTDGGTDGAYRYDFATDQPAFYSTGVTNNLIARDDSAFSSQVFENSPLQRLLKAGMVGSGFQPNGSQHYKSVTYRSNSSSADGNILQWNFDGTLTSGAYYGDNTLAVTEGVDEDGITTRSYTDLRGRTVLKRQVHSGGNLDTYYIYNIAGMLSYVVPPKAIALLAAHSTYTLTASPLNTLVFHYTYDSRGRVITKTVPTGLTINIVYDKWDRPVLMQDANMAAGNKWNYIKYDAKGRAIAQGIYTDNVRTTRTAMQAHADSAVTYWYESRNGTMANGGYYTNNTFPGSSITALAYAYFDDYDLAQTGADNFGYSFTSDALLPGQEHATTAKIKGAATIVMRNVIKPDGTAANSWLTTATFYDKQGHVIQVRSNNYLYHAGDTTLTDSKTVVPDFAGMPQNSKVFKQVAASGTGSTITVYTALTYDHMYRPLTVSQKYNTGAMQQIAAYTYNELGQVTGKGLGLLGSGTVPDSLILDTTYSGTHVEIATRVIKFIPDMTAPSGSDFKAFIGDSYLQTVNYRYNIRGQLLSINNSKLANDGGVTSSDSDDVFGMQMFYDQAGDIGNTAKYNGRLTGVKWMSLDAGGAKSYERRYNYGYDDLGRYTAARYAERTTTGTGSFSNNISGFDERSITYDENGNLLTLSRNSSTQGTNSNIQVDTLGYTYDSNNPNRLLKVADGTGSNYTGYGFRNLTGAPVDSAFTYDANGNLRTDPYKGLALYYNDLNRTSKTIIRTATNRFINYTYDATGVLLRKEVYDNNTLQTTTDYVDGFVYTTTGAGSASLAYFPMPEGRVINTGSALKCEYIITDQQGNARVSFQENPAMPGQALVTQENSYYGYGLQLANSPVGLPTNPNKNLYNGGSEWQNDYSNLPDYYQTFYRNYDAALGRFIGVDPMPESAESLSVYHYAGNNPIMYNDPMGNRLNYDFDPTKPGFNQQIGDMWRSSETTTGFTPGYSSSQYSDYLAGLLPEAGGGSDDVDPITAKAREKGQTIYGNANVKAFFDAIWNGPGVRIMSSESGATWMEYNGAEANNYDETRGQAGMIYYYDNKGGLDGNITATRLPKPGSRSPDLLSGVFGSTVKTLTEWGMENSGWAADYIAKVKFTSYMGIENSTNKKIINYNTTIKNGNRSSQSLGLNLKVASFSVGLTKTGLQQTTTILGFSMIGGVSLSDGFTFDVSYKNSAGQISGYGVAVAPKIGTDIGIAVATFPEWGWALLAL